MPWRRALAVCLALAGPLAAQTRTLPRAERPAWVREEGIVMAGSWEALPMRQRIFGNRTYEPSPQQRADYLREHGPAMIARLKELGVNFVMIHGYRGAGFEAERQSMRDAAEFARRYREAGLRVGVYATSGTFFWDRFFQDVPQAKDWLVLDAQGKPIPYGSQAFRYYFDRNHPEVQAHQRNAVRFAVEEIGADLIHFDNYSVGPGHEPNSAARFRAYLRETWTTCPRNRRFGSEKTAIGSRPSARHAAESCRSRSTRRRNLRQNRRRSLPLAAKSTRTGTM